MFAGIVNLSNKNMISPQLVSEIKSVFLGIADGGTVQSHLGNAFIMSASTRGLSNYSGFYSDVNVISVLAGEPLIENDGLENDHQLLISALSTGDRQKIRPCRGVFCAALFTQKDIPELVLCSDKLGVRPLYYWTDGSFIVFSTLLKVLEKISFITKEFDELSLSEIVGFGFPIGNKTKYKNIKVLREAEVVKFTANTNDVSTYWRWDNIEQRDVSPAKAISNAYEIFKDAIELRLHGDSDSLAFLSGGMDSRAIVCALRDLNIKVDVFNFSPQGFQDQVFAERIAEKFNCKFNMVVFEVANRIGFRCQLARLLRKFISDGRMSAARPRSVWSGDGGSVSLGCVYLDRGIIETLRSGKVVEAIKMFREKNYFVLPLKAMKRNELSGQSKLLDKSIVGELDRLKCNDEGQKLFLFLMLNDQRRHLHDFYEDIDCHKLEYQLPFFDSKLLEYIFSLPLNYRLDHRFYTDWFDFFPDVIKKVPWQTYPGHIPCPVLSDEKLGYQWQKKTIALKERFAKNVQFGLRGLKLSVFFYNVGPLSRYKLFIVSLVQLMGIRDYSYLIEAAGVYSAVSGS